ncbi:MAG: DUF4139 domain-containing protein [Fimbriimonadaceae bacterium]|nr:DUF4139 domain-containing protein [Chthonomonadaceae bacterium]MCO5296238.1 DUF4139 domain-containing protein [Fimbriimonadaceae bacterium]
MKILAFCVVCYVLVGAILGSGCSKAAGVSPEPVAAARGGIELVVYTGDFAQVREARPLELAAGRNRVDVADVSRQLDQASVLYTWNDAKGVSVDSSTYDLGIEQSTQLLQRFLNREIELVYRGDNGKEGERTKGILQVATPGNLVVRVGDHFVVNPNATVEVPANSGIVPVAQLSAEVESKSAQKATLDLAYMTRGLSWSADYTAILDPDSDSMRLECWATVTNGTGIDYPDAKLQFVAGSPNRAVTASHNKLEAETSIAGEWQREEMRPLANPMAMDSDTRPIGELVAYPYKSTATIRQGQMNRVRMMEANEAKLVRDYSVRLPASAQISGGASDQRIRATLAINFTNDESSGLGFPLPAGAVRVYETSDAGTPDSIGAAGIPDTPKNARASLTLTNVFNVYALPKLVQSQQVDKRHLRRRVEVHLHNEKKRAVDVRLVEGFYSAWKIESESSKSTKLDSSTAQWKVSVPAGGETVVKFSVLLG